MSVLDREALEQSPLADLHTIASELSLDGYRRLRKAELIDRILERSSGAQPEAEPDDPDSSDREEEPRSGSRRRRSRRGGRTRSAARDSDGEAEESEDRGATREAKRTETEEAPAEEVEELVEGTVELLPNGSAFVRVGGPEPSDADVYVSAAQVKRCELVSGDQVTGPRRSPRRSERFASLVRVDTINGRPASELVSGARFDDLPAAFPSERFKLDSEDPTLKAIEFLTPFGRGSRVTIAGASRAGKTEALRRLATALNGQEDLQVSVVLAGARPEEIAEWSAGETAPVGAVSFAASADAQAAAVELVVDQARRVASRGGHAVVLIDTLNWLHPHAAAKAIAAARRIVDGGSLTVIATASQPIGGETTVIALDASLTGSGRFPAIDLAASGTLKAELLVGEAGAEAITAARAEAAAQ